MRDDEWQGRLWFMLMVIGGIAGFWNGYKESIWLGLINAGIMIFAATLLMLLIGLLVFIGNGFRHN